MNYKPLEVLYYINEEIYQKEYKQRFNDKSTLHIDFEIFGNPAFCVMNQSIYELLLEINRIDKKILELRHTLPGVALNHFTRRCLIDEIILTNDIEGVISTRRDIDEILNNIDGNKKKRFRGLVQKYYMLQAKTTINLTSCEDIRQIYDELVLNEVAEENERNIPDGQIFRKDMVEVYSPSGKSIHRGLYPEHVICESMQKALLILNDKNIDSLIRAAIFHYLFGYIHPFYDGNGRTDRYISSYLLAQELDPLVSYRFSYTIKENIKSYYDAFKTCNSKRNNGDLTPFVLTFLDIVRTSISALHEGLYTRKILLERYYRIIVNSPILNSEKLSHLTSVLVQATLFSEYGISIKELTAVLEISRNTLLSRLKMLKSFNLIEESKSGRTVYLNINKEQLESMHIKL